MSTKSGIKSAPARTSKMLSGTDSPKYWGKLLVPISGGNMYRVNLMIIFQLGETLSTITDVQQEGHAVHRWQILTYIAEALSEFLQGTARVPLPSSREAAQKLYEFVDAMGKDERDAYYDRREGLAAPGKISQLERLYEKFKKELAHETREINVLSVPEMDEYPTTTILTRGENVLLTRGSREVVSAFVIREMNQAGKCLAFELPSAAGYHMMRAVEAVLRQYYDILSGGKSRPKNKGGQDVPMGHYINEIGQYGVEPKVISALRELKDLDRNPLIHPDRELDMEGALALAGVVKNAISVMVKDMKNRGAVSPPT